MSSTQYRKVRYTKTGLTNAAHTTKVRVVGTAGRPVVSIDGMGYQR